MEACSPHFPTRLLLKGDALRYLARKLIKPTKVPGYLPAGPPSKPPSYHGVVERSASDPNAAMVGWYELARKEFGDLTGRDCAYKTPLGGPLLKSPIRLPTAASAPCCQECGGPLNKK